MKVENIEGIGPAFGERLRATGIDTTDELLEKGASRTGRAAIAEATGIGGGRILAWVDHVDLMRVEGVGPEYSDLLVAAGVGSPAELAQRNAAHLATTLQEVVAARPGIVRRVPSRSEVAGWIERAKSLPRIVER